MVLLAIFDTVKAVWFKLMVTEMEKIEKANKTETEILTIETE